MRKIATIFIILLMVSCGTNKKVTEYEQQWTEEVVDTVRYTLELVDTVRTTVTIERTVQQTSKDLNEIWDNHSMEIEKPDGTKIKYTHNTGQHSEQELRLEQELKTCRDSLAISGKLLNFYRDYAQAKSESEVKTKTVKKNDVPELIFWWIIGIIAGASGFCCFMNLSQKK